MAIMLPQAKALQDRLRAARACGGRPSPEFRAKLQEMHALAEGIRDYVTNPSLIPKSPLSPQAIEALNRIDLSRLRSGGRGDSPEVYAVCFAAGTPVRMADGGWKPIETIQPGELVLCVPKDDPEGEPSARPVVQSYHNEPVEICEVRLSDALIRTTPGHPFYVMAHGWQSASALRPGDRLRDLDGAPVVVTSSRSTGLPEPVFNLQIADHHTYFVGAGNGSKLHGVLVHNQSENPRQRQERWERFRPLRPDDFEVRKNIRWDEEVYCELQVNERVLRAEGAIVRSERQTFPFGGNREDDSDNAPGNTRTAARNAAIEWATRRVQAADVNFFGDQAQYAASRFLHVLIERRTARPPAGANQDANVAREVTATEFRFQAEAVRNAVDAWFDHARTGMSERGFRVLDAEGTQARKQAAKQTAKAVRRQGNAAKAAAAGSRQAAASQETKAEQARIAAAQQQQIAENVGTGLLGHENGHFRITKAYANLLTAEIESLRVVVISYPANSDTEINTQATTLLLSIVNARRELMQAKQLNTNINLYDKDTDHNNNPPRIQPWRNRIQQAMDADIPTNPQGARDLWNLLNTLPH